MSEVTFLGKQTVTFPLWTTPQAIAGRVLEKMGRLPALIVYPPSRKAPDPDALSDIGVRIETSSHAKGMAYAIMEVPDDPVA